MRKEKRNLLLAGLIFVFGIIYIYINTEDIRDGAVINIDKPVNMSFVQSPVIIEGSLKSIVDIRINERKISVNPEKEFKETISLPLGYNVINITGIGRNGKEVREDLEIIVK